MKDGMVGDPPVTPTSFGDAIVVEPLKKKASEAAERQLQKLADKNPLQVKLDAYCWSFFWRWSWVHSRSSPPAGFSF